MNLLATAGSCSDMESHGTLSASDIGAFGSYVSSGAQRSLDMLRAIEQTVMAVSSICDEARSSRRVVAKLNESIGSVGIVIPEDSTVAVFGDAQDALAKVHAHMQKKLEFARQDPLLTAQDGVEDIYVQAIAAVTALHDDIETLRWNIMNHNALLDKSGNGQQLASAEAVDAFLSGL